MNAFEVRGLIQELVDENPLAIRAVLKIVAVEFTEAVPTLAVTCDERPRLLINLGFVKAHCRTVEQVKAALCHEFLGRQRYIPGLVHWRRTGKTPLLRAPVGRCQD